MTTTAAAGHAVTSRFLWSPTPYDFGQSRPGAKLFRGSD